MFQNLTSLEFLVVVLWSSVVTLFYLFGFLFIRQSIKHREDTGIKILILLGFFLILVGLSRTFHPLIWIATYDDIYLYVSQILIIAAIIMIVFYVEREVFPSSHHITTILLLIGEVLYIINTDLFSLPLAFVMLGACLFIIILYLRIAFSSTGDLRHDAYYIIIGIILFAGIFAVSLLEDFGFSQELTGIISAFFAYTSLPFLLKGFHLSI